MATHVVTEYGAAERLVESDPAANLRKAVEADLGVLGKSVRGGAIWPAALLLETLGKIPVVERNYRLDTSFQELRDETLIVVDTLLVHRAGATGNDSRPSHGETIRSYPKTVHKGDVLGIPMILVSRNVSSVAMGNHPGGVGIRVPN